MGPGRGARGSGQPRLGGATAVVQKSRPGGGTSEAATTASAGHRHRPSCTCVICRRIKSNAKGLNSIQPSGEEEPPTTEVDDEAAARPNYRIGKAAYVQALALRVTAGATPSVPHEVPLSRCWSPAEWVEHRHGQRTLRNAAAKSGTAGTGAAKHLTLVQQQQLQRAATVYSCGGARSIIGSLAAEVSLGPGAGRRRAMPARDKLALCRATERARVAFGKSGIHGWGLFARAPMPQDSMVIEYTGELLRCAAADAREAAYRNRGRDCYLFDVDGSVVLDSTRAGTIARFTASFVFFF
jgi:hypothetical protein